MTFDEIILAARAEAARLEQHYTKGLEDIPRSPAEVEDALVELANIEDAMQEHVRKFPGGTKGTPDFAAWSDLCDRRDAAVKTLTRLGAGVRDRRLGANVPAEVTDAA